MNAEEMNHFLTSHGLWLVFAVVLLEQLGLPIPAPPLLLAAGALAAAGKFSLIEGTVVAVVACLLADMIWFYLGQRQGVRVLGWMCRISLEPDSCVRRTQNVFTKYGLKGVVFAKFVPGLSTIAPPLAGMSGVSGARFLLFDGAGSLLYCGLFLVLGDCFGNQISQIGAALEHLGGRAVAFLAVAVAVYLGVKYWQRQRLLKELHMARITVAELKQKLEAGEQPIILDLRSKAELQLDPTMIHGAFHVEIKDLEVKRTEIPADRDVVVYCSCPNEVTSARVALLLQRKGYKRVRPLMGGIAAWRQNEYPLSAWTSTVTQGTEK